MSDQHPKFLREFSKETNANARKEAAAHIRETRREERSRKENLERLTQEIETLKSTEVAKTAESLEAINKKIEDLDKDVGKLQKNWFTKLTNFRKIAKLKKQIAQETSGKETATEENSNALLSQSEKERQLQELEARHSERGQDILTRFYAEEQKRWADAEVDWETMEKYFNAKALSALSLEDYAKLLQRFPQEMVTHVSRRGIRDHADLSEHQDNEAYEHHDAFDKVLEAKTLKSNIGIKLEQDTAAAYVEKELRLHNTKTREEAEAELEKVVNRRGWASFADFSAVHFAAEDVADNFYGSERENEVFIAYPSALVATAYEFGGHYTDLAKPNSDATRNDVWVWSKEEEGMPLDAGIVFLPKESRVDPETGSRYALTPEKKPIVDHDVEQLYEKLASNEAFHELVLETYQADLELHDRVMRESQKSGSIFDTQDERTRRAREMYQKESQAIKDAANLRMQEEFGISDPRIQNTFYGSEGERAIRGMRAREKWEFDMNRDRFLKKAGVHIKLAEETVSGQEFWESYFTKHPERKPSKIVYYEGNDPMQALRTWREENGITKKSADAGIDYQTKSNEAESVVNTSNPAERFRSIARSIIDTKFPPT